MATVWYVLFSTFVFEGENGNKIKFQLNFSEYRKQ